MGDRFYFQQQNYKPKRRLKKDIVSSIEEMLNKPLPSLNKMTNKDLEELEDAIYHFRE